MKEERKEGVVKMADHKWIREMDRPWWSRMVAEGKKEEREPEKK